MEMLHDADAFSWNSVIFDARDLEEGDLLTSFSRQFEFLESFRILELENAA